MNISAAEVAVYILAFIYGIVLGSFLNVLIYRIPNKENFTTERSHCMTCGTKIKWYDLIPVFSYIFLRGRCRSCKSKISVQYPIVEGLNGLLYVIIFIVRGITLDSVLIAFVTSIFIVISVIDWRTYEIPFGLNIVIFVLAVIRIGIKPEGWIGHLIGFVAVSGFMLICLIIGRMIKGVDAFGGGDIKLMAAAGLFAGWKCVILAFLIGCVLGAVIHSIRMKLTDADRVLAFGPYLCVGLFISILFGNNIIDWYLGML